MESTTYHSKKAARKKEDSRKEMGLTSETLSTSCRSRNKSLKQNTTIKAPFVPLKNISRGRKAKHDYCLTASRGKQTQHKKFAAFRKLQVALFDILDKNYIPTLKTSFQISNVGELLEKGKNDTTETDNSVEAGFFSGELDPGQTNSDCDIRKSGNGDRSSKFLALSDQSVCATLPFIEPNHGEEPEMDPYHVQTEKLNTKCLGPIEKYMETGSHVVKETEKEGAYCEAEDDQDVEIMFSRGPSGRAISDVIQSYNPPPFPKTSVRRRIVLIDKKSHEGNRCQTSEALASFSDINHTLDPQTPTSNQSEIKLPVKEMRGLSLNPLTEKIREDQMTLEEEESNARESSENVERFCFLLKDSDVRYDEHLAGDLERFGSLVKLLGSPTVTHEKSSLERLAELEDSPDVEECEDSDTWFSSKRRKEGRRCFASRATCIGCRTKENTRPKRTPKPIPRSWLSEEQSRIKVMEVLTETLQKRLNDSLDPGVPKNIASEIAKEVEMEIFKHFGRVDRLYKNKYRSLLFNLKSTDNQLFHKLILGKITPRRLVEMNSLEMASKELAEWRAKENKHELEMIEKHEREMPKRCSEKFTHKGIVEIYREADIDVASEEVIGSSLLEVPSLTGSNQIRESRLFEPATYKFTFSQEANPSETLHQNLAGSEIDKRPEDEGRSALASTANRNRPLAKKSSYSVIWNGLIQVPSVKRFVAKAYPVSGFGPRLCQALPTVLQSEGCILPKDVWAYVDSIWPTKREEMGVIRFRPSLSRDFNSYHTLYTYLNNRQRYGIVESSQMEVFLVPLPAYQLVPPQFHPVGGPGLDQCHPALLLGLILPKRPRLDILEASHDLPPKAKKKRVTFNVSPENCSFAAPSHFPGDVGQDQSPPPLCTEGLPSDEGLSILPKPEELTIDSLLGLIEQIKRDVLCTVPPSSCQQDARDEVHPTPLGDTFHSTADSALTGEQLSNLTLGILGAQPCLSGQEIQFGVNPQPSDIFSFLGSLLSSGVSLPDQHGTPTALPYATQEMNPFENPLLRSVLCAEAVAPVEQCQAHLPPQIPYTNTIGEGDPPVQETLPLDQYVAQMQSSIQSLEAQPFSLLTQEMISALSQIPAFPVQQGGGYYMGPSCDASEGDQCDGTA
ncbi:SPOC domain-containing protein 1 isoform X1 [Erythrolamprus reginae]|uniref:SPOC domain-containing protein 1 isoform X1 n=1 Tax=Erythrolamprus reginae TaxID=121349 RepID=UPI00396CFF55